jgi:hypothetical protein
MKIQWADQGAGSSRESLDWRIERHNLLIGSIRDDADRVHAAGKIALEYVWPNNNQSYLFGHPKGYDLSDPATRRAIAEHLTSVVAQKGLDGLFVDCPLDHEDLRAALDIVRLLMELMPDKAIMGNFGSYDVFELPLERPPLSRLASLRDKRDAWWVLRDMLRWCFVEVAIHTRTGWEVRYQRARDAALQQIEAGKHVVLGIDDTQDGVGPHRPDLAAAIAGHLPRHPNLYVAYRSAVVMPHGAHPADYKWNETLEALR